MGRTATACAFFRGRCDQDENNNSSPFPVNWRARSSKSTARPAIHLSFSISNLPSAAVAEQSYSTSQAASLPFALQSRREDRVTSINCLRTENEIVETAITVKYLIHIPWQSLPRQCGSAGGSWRLAPISPTELKLRVEFYRSKLGLVIDGPNAGRAGLRALFGDRLNKPIPAGRYEVRRGAQKRVERGLHVTITFWRCRRRGKEWRTIARTIRCVQTKREKIARQGFNRVLLGLAKNKSLSDALMDRRVASVLTRTAPFAATRLGGNIFVALIIFFTRLRTSDGGPCSKLRRFGTCPTEKRMLFCIAIRQQAG